MTPAWAQRQKELRRDCIVSPDVFNLMVVRLRDVVVPYQHAVEAEASGCHVHLYFQGLLSHVDRKNAEKIASLVDVERQVLQDFIGTTIGRREIMHGTRWRLSTSGILMLMMIAWGIPTVAGGQGAGPWDMPMMRGGWGIVMIVMMVIFWATVMIAIVFFIRWLINSGGPRQRAERARDTENALEILQKRYTRGEISKPDYEEMRRDLQ